MALTPDISIITVSWNVWDLLRACLAELERHSAPTADPQLRLLHPAPGQSRALSMEVVVVDAASADATPALLPVLFPWVRLLPAKDNVGFPRGNNLGFQASRGRTAFFLNPDTLARAPAIVRLHEALYADDRLGAVGPALIRGDGRLQDSRRLFPAPLTGFLESTWLGRVWARNPWARRYRLQDWPAAFAQRTDWLEGAALMVRREAFAETGGFDEAFFMYSEEPDLCRRLRVAGWRILYCPQARITHFGGRSSAQVPAQTHIAFNTSKVLYYRKHWGPGWAEALRRYLLLEFGLLFGLEGAKLLLGHKISLRQHRVQAYWQVLASRLRP